MKKSALKREETVYQLTELPQGDLPRRRRNYVLAMSIRTLCFLGMIVVPLGAWTIVLAVLAVFLPLIAVLFANAQGHDAPHVVSPHADLVRRQPL